MHEQRTVKNSLSPLLKKNDDWCFKNNSDNKERTYGTQTSLAHIQ